MKHPEKFLFISNNKFNNKFEYDLKDYKNISSKIRIVCPEHGDFIQSCASHMVCTYGCPKCADNNVGNSLRFDIKTIIENMKEVHNNKYDYSLIDFKDYNTKIKIICSKHDIFEQLINNHMRGQGCPKCSTIISSNKQKTNVDDFIIKANVLHNNIYDYSLVEYINSKTKIKIICPNHGIFLQTPNNHTKKGCPRGCPKCKKSHGEMFISKYLDNINISYIQEKTFDECKNERLLRFDFYLPEHNICIEYDGRQHFEPIDRFGGEEYLLKVMKNDSIKNEYCSKNNIELVRISYKEKNIKKILENIFK